MYGFPNGNTAQSYKLTHEAAPPATAAAGRIQTRASKQHRLQSIYLVVYISGDLYIYGGHHIRKLAPRDGFEPPAKRLTVACSTTELPGKSLCSVIQHKIHHATPFFASAVPNLCNVISVTHLCSSKRSASSVIASGSSVSASITAMSLWARCAAERL